MQFLISYFRLQNQMIASLDAMLHDNEAARRQLGLMSEQHGFSTTVSTMLKSGFSVKTESFLFALMRAGHAKRMLDLKLKSRVS